MLKNKSELLQQKIKIFFGREFREKISEARNSHKQSRELFLKILQVETSLFGKVHRQASNIVGDGRVLKKATTRRGTGTPTGITSTMVYMQIKTTLFKEIPCLIPREKLSYAHKL